MHVDGGATKQLILFSTKNPVTPVTRALGMPLNRTLYFVINKTLKKPHDECLNMEFFYMLKEAQVLIEQ